MNDDPAKSNSENDPNTPKPVTESASARGSADEYTDHRALWDWKTRYPPEACRQMRLEAAVLSICLAIFLVLCGLALGLRGQSASIPLEWIGSTTNPNQNVAGAPLTLSIDFRLFAIFFAGSVGGTTFSIKWLIHAAAKGKWHLDRRYWRLFVPFIGGTYACVVMTFLDSGFIAGASDPDAVRPIAISSAFAFLVGYFSDGVSGLLSNIAKAVFGTLEKK